MMLSPRFIVMDMKRKFDEVKTIVTTTWAAARLMKIFLGIFLFFLILIALDLFKILFQRNL